jgi:hypothetical protein
MQNFNDCINGVSDGTKDANIFALTTAGATTLGASASVDLVLNAALASTVAIKTNTTYAIGSATKGLSAIYLGGTSTFTIGVVAPTLAASYTLTYPAAVPAATALISMSSTGALALAAATRQTTSPAIARYQFADAIQPAGATAAVIDQFSASTRTLEVADSASGTASPLVTSAAPATHGLLIVRGTIASDKTTVTRGEGFTSASGGTGIFDITFTTAFATAPTVVATAETANAVLYIMSVSTTQAHIQTFSSTTGSAVGSHPINFIAIGERGA